MYEYSYVMKKLFIIFLKMTIKMMLCKLNYINIYMGYDKFIIRKKYNMNKIKKKHNTDHYSVIIQIIIYYMMPFHR